MIAAPASELLHPLTLFRGNDPGAVPAFEPIDGARMPQPYRELLVHHGDMTSRLEAFYGGEIVLELLHCEHTVEAYRREVVLRVAESRVPVEYGAIEINLARFDEDVRAAIIEAHLPLGGILNRFRVQYRSEPKAFVRIGPDSLMAQLFDTPTAQEYYGRCNVLRGADGEVLAQIVEVLRP